MDDELLRSGTNEIPQPKQLRPPSSQTNNSFVEDSAISMGEGYSRTLSDTEDQDPPHPQVVEQSLSNRLKRCSEIALQLEQNGRINGVNRQGLDNAVDSIVAFLEGDGELLSGHKSIKTTTLEGGDTQYPYEQQDESFLEKLRESLAATVASMRLRQQEHRHLNQLYVQKIEAVANTCLIQEEQLEEVKEELASLQQETESLRHENDQLLSHNNELHGEAEKREAALTAMSSAVAGLEGWISASQHRDDYQPRLQTPKSSRRTVVRGRGRFRGRYHVDAADGHDLPYGLDGISQVTELHDGVQAWLRGFRDVEEELQFTNSGHLLQSKEARHNIDATTDDWGEFESAPVVQRR